MRLQPTWMASVLAVGLAGTAVSADPPKLDRYGDPLPPGAVERLGPSRHRLPNAVFSFQADKLVALSWGKYLTEFDLATGLPKSTKALPIDNCRTAILFPDGKRAALCRPHPQQPWMSQWEIWNLEKPEKTATIDRQNDYNQMNVAVSSNGNHLAGITMNWDNAGQAYVFVLVDTKTGKSKEVDRHGFGNNGGGWTLTPRFTPDGSAVVHGFAENQQTHVKCFDIVKQEQRWERIITTKGYYETSAPAIVGSVCLVNTGNAFESLDVATGKDVKSPYPKDANPGRSLAISADGNRMVFMKRGLLGGNFLQSWDLKANKAEKSIELGKSDRVGGETVMLSPDGKRLLVHGSEMHFFDLEKGTKLWGAEPNVSHVGEVNQLRFTSDGKRLITGGSDQKLRLWNLADAKVTGTWTTGYTQPVMEWHSANSRGYGSSQDGAFGLSADGRRMVVAEGSGMSPKLRVIDLANGQSIASLPEPPKQKSSGRFGNQTYVGAVGLSADGESVFATSGYENWETHLDRNTALSRYDLATKKWVELGKTESAPITRSAYSRTGGQLYTFGLAFDTVAGKEVFEFAGAGMGPMAVSTDGRLVAGTGRATDSRAESIELPNIKDLRVWEAGTGQLVGIMKWLPPGVKEETTGNGRRFNGQDDKSWAWPRKLAIHPSGRLVATSDFMGVRLWDVVDGKVMHTFPFAQIPSVESGMGRPAGALAFSPDGTRLATGMLDGTVLLWDVPKPKANPAVEADLAALWTDLSGTDPGKAWRAVWRLSAAPELAVRLLKDKLTPSPRVPATDVQNWITDLDNRDYRKREAASKRLSAVADRAYPELRTALVAPGSPEQKERLKAILAQGPGEEKPLATWAVTTARAVAVLERVATPASKELLATLTTGAPGAWQTTAAKEALDRLK